MTMEAMPLEGPRGIIVHHSASKDGPGVNLEELRRIHIQENGWEDIGYHFIIEDVKGIPVIFEGRSLQYTGAHCPGKNNYIGICLVGNYSVVPPEPKSLEKLFSLIKGLMLIYKFSPEKVCRHSEYKSTECPGTLFPWDNLKQRIIWFHKACQGYF